MPRTALLLGTGLAPTGDYPYSITIAGIEVAPNAAELQSIRFQDNGDDEPGTLTMRLWDRANTLAIPDQGTILVQENSTDEQVWAGVVQRKRYNAAAVGRYIDIEGVSLSTLLNEIFIVREQRPSESDRARVLYLWGKYARWPLSNDMSQVTQTAASIAADDILSMTLGSALRFTMALAGSTNRLAIDPLGRLHWFAGSEVDAAPYNINRAMVPGGGNIAPDELKVERDGVIKNRVYVRGSTEAGSGWYQDDASVAAYGARETPIDAPSADTAAKALSIARMYFGRVAQPRTRGTFQTEEPYNGWRSAQNVTITDPANDLAAQSFRIARVTTSFTKGTGTRRYVVEFGGVRPRGSDVEDDILGRTLLPGQAVAGDTFDNDGNLLISGGLSGASGGFGPAIRRYITSGVYNGDFALAPPYPDSTIVEAWNPLPFWTFVQAGGTAITAQSVADSASGSGRVLRFDMAGGGIAGDDSYIEQIIPVNASRSQAYAYRVRCAFETGPTVSLAEVYIHAQYLLADGVTATGTEGVREYTTALFGTSTIVDIGCAAGTSDGLQGGQVPADAYFLRVRIGFKRDTAATTVTETLGVLEAHIIVGASGVLLEDITTPANPPAHIFKSGGSVYVADSLTAAGAPATPWLRMTDATDTTDLSSPLRISTAAVTRAGYAVTDTTAYGLVIGDGVRAKPITPVGWAVRGSPQGAAANDSYANSNGLAINGGSISAPMVVTAPMTLTGYAIRNVDVASLRTCEFRLYLSRLNDSATCDEVAGSAATDSFTPGAASTRIVSLTGADIVIAPGIYWLVVRNTSAAQTFGLASTAVTSMGQANQQTKTIAGALGATLDLVTGWTQQSNMPGMSLVGTQPDASTW